MIFVCILIASIRELCLTCIAVGRIEFHGRRYVEGEMSIGVCFAFCFLQSRRNTGWLVFSVLGDIAAGAVKLFMFWKIVQQGAVKILCFGRCCGRGLPRD